MYVPPSTKIVFLRNVPLDNTYEHTLFFYDRPNSYGSVITGKEWQRYYFDQKANRNGTTLTGQSYQDHTNNIIRVEGTYKNLYDSNYMFFEDNKHNPLSIFREDPLAQNPNYLSLPKRFYCFVTRVSYVNENVVEVEFEIDVMQTYMFDYELKECFIDREHSATDNWYENTIPENLEIGNEYICQQRDTIDLNPNVQPDTVIHSMKVCILTNRFRSGQTPVWYDAGACINNVFCGLRPLMGYYASDAVGIGAVLNGYLPEEIIAIYQYPNIMTESNDVYGSHAGYVGDKEFPRAGLEFGTYTAKNAKLGCFPYKKLIVSDNAGNISEYKYECFARNPRSDDPSGYDVTNNIYFYIEGVAVTQAAIAIMPYRYKNIKYNYDEGMVMANFPECSWAGDAYKSWWAQIKNQFQAGLTTSALGYVANGISALAQASSGNAVGAFAVAGRSMISLHTSVMQQMAKMQDIKNVPNATRGVAQTSTLNAEMERYRFDLYEMGIKEEYARIIDRYFSRFGYKTNKIKVPNRNVRNHWTYTKTVGCALTEKISSDVARKICSIYDNGITFWRYYDTRYNLWYDSGGVGHYDLEPNVGDYTHYAWVNEVL